MTPSLRSLAALAAFAALAAGAASAADIDAGRKKVQEVCAACHGIDGTKPVLPEYPKLGGQYPDYLQKALRDYQSGARKNPIMSAFAKQLSDRDIANVTAYFSAQDSVLASRY